MSTQGKRVLDPISEFRSFCLSSSWFLRSVVIERKRGHSVRAMLLEALGCNVAGNHRRVFYLLNSVGQRGQGAALLGSYGGLSTHARLWHGCGCVASVSGDLDAASGSVVVGKINPLPESIGDRDLSRIGSGAGSVSAGVFVDVPHRDSFYSPRQPRLAVRVSTVLLSHCCFWPVIRSDSSRNTIRGDQGW